ncbi:MAG: TIGR00374 family protein [Candidatus Micrarchaeota archaeon]|nr:MAG: TIGR00374 family protein [Candidatus Micrarchaeota archaeon]
MHYNIGNEDHKLEKAVNLVVILLIVSLAIFVLIALLGNYSKIIGYIRSANLFFILLAILSVFFGYILRFFKWSYYLRKLNIKIKLLDNLATYLSLYAMNLTPGKLGRLLNAFIVKRLSNASSTEAASAIIMDIYTDFMGAAVLGIVLAIVLAPGYYYIITVALIDIALISPYFILINNYTFSKIRKYIGRIRYVKRFRSIIIRYIIHQEKLNTIDTYITSIIFTVPAYLLNSFSLYFAFRALGINSSIFKSSFVFTFAQLIGMVTGVPGNLGFTDISLVKLSQSLLSLSYNTAAAATIISRIASLWFGVVLGLILLTYLVRKSARSRARFR